MPRTIEPQSAEWMPGSGVKGSPDRFGKFKYSIVPGMAQNPFGVYGGAKESLEKQYPVAREAILSTVPGRGGQMNDQLFNLEKTRASEVGGLKERIISNALSLASGAAFQQPAALSLQDNSLQRQALQAQLAQSNTNAGSSKKAGGLGALGQITGAGIGAGLPLIFKK